MKLRLTSYFGLAAMLAISLTGLTANAQQLQSAKATSQQDLNLSDAQVLKIHSLLVARTKEIQALNLNVQSAQEALSAAVAASTVPRTTPAKRSTPRKSRWACAAT